MEGLVNDLRRLVMAERQPTAIYLATELWREILSHLESPGLSAMRLVAREQRGLANSFLFKSCILRISGPEGLHSKLAFYTSSAISHAVRDCTVLGGGRNTPTAVAEICAALNQFKNLRHLTFQYVRMSPTTVAAIYTAALPKDDLLSLVSLSLVSCITDFPASSGDEMSAIALKSVLIHNEHIPNFTHDYRWLSLLNLDLLQMLDLAQPHMTHIFIECLAQTPGMHLPMLESLQLHLSGLDYLMDKFLSVLTSFPSLRIFGVTAGPANTIGSYSRGHTRIAIPDDSLPLLTSFHGLVTHGAAYCAGRKLLLHLKLYDSQHNQASDSVILLPALQEIVRAAPQLRSLELRIAFPLEELTPTLASSLPTLRSLRVIVPCYPGRTILALDDALRTLGMLVVPRDLEVLFIAYRVADRVPWSAMPNHSAEMVSAIRDLTQRVQTLQKICICCDLPNAWGWDDFADRSDRTMVWLWTRRRHASEMVSQQTVAGAECIDGRKTNLRIRAQDFQTYTAADALDDEWRVAAAAHRIA
ncbi:hypothetical protein MVEN_00442800 [Mycena venus]|uniref:F-box domain-containing protein n=1 Tax=Mycena venus TaxID=2733690 RepID=A0A8H6YWP2_9AGAR|nr:hypothetical protein MVEN_00442800 [Mycena venus]